MIRNFVASALETLAGAAKSSAKQAGKQVKKTGDDVAVELGLKPLPPIGVDGKAPAAHDDEQLKKLKTINERRTAANYRRIQQEIAQLEKRREGELPEYVTGTPQFDKEKAVEQLQVSQRPTASLGEGKPQAEKPKLPPISVRREQNKAERHRGVSG